MTSQDYVAFNADGHAFAIGVAEPDVFDELLRHPATRRVEARHRDEAVQLHLDYLYTLPEMRSVIDRARAAQREVRS